MPFLLLDVEVSATNRALAMEKALTKPQSQRRTAKPVLRGKLHASLPLSCHYKCSKLTSTSLGHTIIWESVSLTKYLTRRPHLGWMRILSSPSSMQSLPAF